jgi:hypothetical protein
MDGSMTTQIKGDATSTFGSDIDVTGNVVTDAPAFFANLTSDQTLTTGTWSKITFDEERFDVTNDFDNSTNYRFTPSVAGYYQISVGVRCFATSMRIYATRVYKNGTSFGGFDSNNSYGAAINSNTPYLTASSSGLIYCNGSTDYLEVYARVDGTSPKLDGVNNGLALCWFSGFLARAV